MAIRFTASGPATNKALQEVRVLEGFGLFDTTPPWTPRGASLQAMAGALAAAGIRTAAGQPLSPTQVRRHLERLGLA